MKNRKIWCGLVLLLMLMTGMTVSATNVTTIQNQKAQNEKELKAIQSKITSLESKRNEIVSELDGLNDEMMTVLVNIEIMESDLADKEVEIEAAQAAFEEAQATEARQYDSMKRRIQYLYESSETGYLEALLASQSVAELVNKVDYAEELQEYDRRLLEGYKAAKQAVIDLQIQLEEEKLELLSLEDQLKAEQASLEKVISKKKSEAANFESQLKNAKAKASDYQKKIKEQNAQIKKLQEEAAKKAAQNASGKGSATVSGGTGLGGSIASYGLQFVGRPYVWGGNSLTNGTDCSGFVYLIHRNFGITTPRQSTLLRYGGAAVSDVNKLPGDVICYDNHVGIYIGNNQIVHASSERTGIKVSNMYYKSVLGIRRYW